MPFAQIAKPPQLLCPSTSLESITDALRDKRIDAKDYAKDEKVKTPDEKHAEANDPRDSKEDLDKTEGCRTDRN